MDIDLFVCGNSSAKTMAEKRKQISKCFCSRMKHFNQRKSCENERQSGRPRKTVDCGDRKILCCVKRNRRQSLTEIMQTKCIMSCQTRFLQGLFVDNYDSMGSQGEIFVRPSPFGPRTDIAVYIGVDKNLDGF